MTVIDREKTRRSLARALPFVAIGLLAVFAWAAAGWVPGLLILLLGVGLGAAIALGAWRDVRAGSEVRAAAFRASLEELPPDAVTAGAAGPVVELRPAPVQGAPRPNGDRPVADLGAGGQHGRVDGNRLPGVLSEIRMKADIDLPGALADAESLRGAHPGNPAVLALSTRLALAAGRDDVATLASEALRAALTQGAISLAGQLFRDVWDHREDLTLGADAFGHLGRILWRTDDYAGAAWALERAASLESESPDDLARDLIAVASGARRGDDPALALRIYDRLLTRRPDSPYAPWLRGQAEALRRRLPARA